MASSYPGGIDSLPNPATSDSMAVVSHAGQHADANDAIEAIETELGTNPSGASASVKDRLDTLAVGPGSSTDNALVRFDGTDGKTVQNSGITVNDSGYITSDVVVVKASPVLRSSGTGHADIGVTTSSGGYARLTLDRAAGQFGIVYFQTAGSSRWAVIANGDTESGSNAGSNFALYSYTDAGALLRTDLTVNRATGKTTLGSVGATAGLELGSSGPRVMSGTGSPESVVTAPVGSTWIDTAATTGAVKWLKATGAGNTGWVVEYGDTGWRDLSASNENGWTGVVMLRRVGKTVHMLSEYANEINAAAATGTTIFTNDVPVGFRPPAFAILPARHSGNGLGSLLTTQAGALTLVGGLTALSYAVNGSYLTDEAWPSSLPGVAV